MTRIAVVIVNFNTRDLLRMCLQSLATAATSAELEIWVVDNGSRDQSVAMVTNEFPQVRIIESTHNGGFSYANNLAIRPLIQRPDAPEYIMILNPDTIVEVGAFDVLLAYLQAHPDVGAVGPRLILPDGSLDLACRRSFPTPEVSLWRMTGLSRLFPQSRRFGRYNMTYMDPHETIEVDALVGACMLMPIGVIREVGLLDETYFMYGEDLDWCYRFKLYGWRIVYVADALVHHIKRASSRQRPAQSIVNFYDAMRIFFRRYYAATTPAPVRWLIETGITLKERSELVRNNYRPTNKSHGAR
ncbi:MAG: glycosyltransferase family 2 protein [Roseiflexaceae bacterium]